MFDCWGDDIGGPWVCFCPRDVESQQKEMRDPLITEGDRKFVVRICLFASIAVDPMLNVGRNRTHWGQGVNYPVGPC